MKITDKSTRFSDLLRPNDLVEKFVTSVANHAKVSKRALELTLCLELNRTLEDCLVVYGQKFEFNLPPPVTLYVNYVKQGIGKMIVLSISPAATVREARAQICQKTGFKFGDGVYYAKLVFDAS